MIDLDKLLNIKREKKQPSQGKVLISNPLLSDFFFRKSVVLLVDHGVDGSFGVIINKPLEFRIHEVTTSFTGLKTNVYLGGPVKTDGVFYLHRLGSLIPGSIGISQGLWWGGDPGELEKLLSDPDFSGHEMVRFYLGYSGWVTGQLDEEILNKSWLISDISPEEVIGSNSSGLWDSKVIARGKEFESWLKFPVDPSCN
jgi:putative transcriptional regulator